MGWRFRRSVKLLPGVRLNFSKSRVSTSIGGRGAHVTIGHGQVRETVGIPGTGISYSTVRSSRKRSASQPQSSASQSSANQNSASLSDIFIGFLVLAGFVATAATMIRVPEWRVPIGIGLAVLVFVVWPIVKALGRRRPEKTAAVQAQGDAQPPAVQSSVESGNWYDLQGPGTYAIQVAGTSHHQDELQRLAGGERTRTGKHTEVTAPLAYEPNNPYDVNAVRVEIDGVAVGHLPKAIAPVFRSATQSHGTLFHAKAMIVGGWHDEQGDGSFGVRLDL